MKVQLSKIVIAALAIVSVSSFAEKAEKTVIVGGGAMYPSKDIIDNAVNSKDHTSLVAAVKAAGLVDTLKSPGPFTVFAPTNEAFAKIRKEDLETLMKPESKATLSSILTYHVIPKRLSAMDIKKMIKLGKGSAVEKTVNGGSLTFTLDGKDILVTDAKGGKSRVTIADVNQKNGVIHVVDTVLMP